MSIFVGFLARASTRGSMCFTPIAFGGVVMLLPGYTMASGIIELASRHIISGIVRMVYAIMYSFLLGYGLSMGSSIYIAIDSKAVPATQDAQCVSPNRMTAWWNWLWVPLFGFAYCIWLKARPRRFPIMIIFGGIAYTASFLLQTYANAPAQVSQFLPAFGIGLLGNLWSRLRHEMSFDGMLLGVFFLVPGSVGLRSGIALMGGEDINGSGAGFALAMIESAIGIAVGLFSATLIVYPKGTVHTPLMSF
ncbi:hypothetical protein BZG36_04795 [Bifiguratus adelaidae]|uniref:Threonine/serine exporter-like N-terminal domain-containing protein n=1 Tax=Bifiguratus adelaidae TaxID=1938954 RepID=A0A261XTZ5_9FUNG|nr:hypothetical protein BZG36_04795 [Bifiguratus adelaidae]